MAKLLNGTTVYGTATVQSQLFVQSIVASTSTTTGALVVTGGVGIGGTVFISNSTGTNSTLTGALVVGGGVGIFGGLYVSASFTATSITATTIISTSTRVIGTATSTSTTTGALVVAGSIGLGGSIYAGNSITAVNGIYAVNSYTGAFNDGVIVDYYGGTGATGSGRISVGANDVLSIYNNGTATTLIATFSTGTSIIVSTSSSVSTTTGALQIVGGVGIGGNLNLGGTLTSSGTATVNYTPATTVGSAIVATGSNTQGGTNYFDFLKVTNTNSTATGASKSLRINNSGTFEIINNAYNATIFSVTDIGYIAINQATGVTNGIPGNNAIAMNSNSYIYDDGNYHLTSKVGSIWINANGGSDVNINTQVPAGTTPGGLNVQGAVTSQGSGTAATSFISGQFAYSGVALQMSPNGTGAANQAIRDTSSAASTMYFDVNTGGSANGTFKFRSSNSFNELMVLNNTNATINRQMLIGGGSQTAYVSINSSNSYNISGSYGYLSGGGAGSIGSGGNTGNVGFSLYCSGRIQSNEVDVPSDERLKDIQGTIPLDKALQFVRAIDGILYTWKPGFGDEGLKSGFSAQGVYKAGFDHMVVPVPNDRVEGSTDADGFTSPDKAQLTLNYMEAIPYHHEVIKNLLARIEQLEATVAALTTK